MPSCIFDTNVLVVAHKKTPEDCAREAKARLEDVMQRGVLVLDEGGLILREYRDNIDTRNRQLTPGSAFLLWAMSNRKSPHIHTRELPMDGEKFMHFPNDAPELSEFDRSDRKFVALSRAHPGHPPIVVAADRGWPAHAEALAQHGVLVEMLCADGPTYRKS